MRRWLPVLLLACSPKPEVPGTTPDHDTPAVDTDPIVGGDTDVEAWCAVDALLAERCLACHGPAGLGGLRLDEDAHRALVDVASTLVPSSLLVTPGVPEASFLLRKLEGSLEAGEGQAMPPGTPLTPGELSLVVGWVADGAADRCGSEVEVDPPARHHPDGFVDPTVHGHAAKYQDERCVDCHGDDLLGRDGAVSCDTCHPTGWRTDCTFCHGDPVVGTPSPPVHLSGADDGLAASFVPHRAHTDDTLLHAAFPCETCHQVPSDVLSFGHVFLGDTTAGQAEVDLSGGLSATASWEPAIGNCSNLYCHGTGRGADGEQQHTQAVTTCHDCHPDRTTGRDSWERMSGEHEDHLREGVGCHDCHGDTTADSRTIRDPSVHVDGQVQLRLPSSITRQGGTCAGRCHGEEHRNETW